MTKRKKIRIISYVSFAVFCALLYFYLLNSQLTYYKRVSNNNYQRAFAEFVTNFDEMNTALEKSKYASSPQMLSTMCTQVYGKAQSAQMALGVLPFSDDALGETSSFISRVGDYSLTLSGTAASGDVEDSTYELLSALSDVSSEITAELRNMYNDMSRSSLTITDMASQDAQISNMDKTTSIHHFLTILKRLKEIFRKFRLSYMTARFPMMSIQAHILLLKTSRRCPKKKP